MYVGYWWETQKERDHGEGQDEEGCTIFKMDLREIEWDGMDWIEEGSCEHDNVSSGSV
jgi:hypothetical protein